jgi:hypothetical protein
MAVIGDVDDGLVLHCSRGVDNYIFTWDQLRALHGGRTFGKSRD